MLASAGCSLAGTWKRVSVQPDDAPFPFAYITFDDKDQFTATQSVDTASHTDSHTVTGTYKWGWRRLILSPTDPQEQEQVFSGYRRLDGKLVLTPAGSGKKRPRAVLAKTVHTANPTIRVTPQTTGSAQRITP